MKVLLLPFKLLQFWYPEALVVFLRTWKHTILYLEEDLAVDLMFKLLFIPLFHDASIMGRILSFGFRSFRILIGLFAFISATILLWGLAATWFLTPLLAVALSQLGGVIFKILLFSGVVLFAHHILSHPPKKLWQIKNAKDIWHASWIKNKHNNLPALLKTDSVKLMLVYLEKAPADFTNFSDSASDEGVVQKVWELARKINVEYIGPEHLFTARILSSVNAENYLMTLNLKPSDLIDALDFLAKRNSFWKVYFLWDKDFHIKHLKGVNRGWLGIPTPTLDAVSEDLTRKASKEYIEDFIGRSEILAQIINTLSLEKGRNVILVGEPGTGKSALALYLAKLIVAGDAPDAFATKRLVKLDIAGLLTGITSQGDLASRIKTIFEEIKSSGDIVIFIDEIQNLEIGEAGSQFNLFALLLPYIESSDFQFLATTERLNYTKIIEKNGAFARLFTKVELPQATIDESIEILKIQAIEHERVKKIKTSILAIKATPELVSQYIHDRYLPDSALQIYTQCLVKAGSGWVTKKVVEEVIQARVNIPIGEVTDVRKKQQLLNLEQLIHRMMIDQNQAVASVANVLRRASTGLREKNRPIGSFLFVGPTGVGKTELARILAEVYFAVGPVTSVSGVHPHSLALAAVDAQDLSSTPPPAFLRFDMSEYQNPESVVRLIGGPGEEGLLTEAVRNRPFALLLLDEFEKANEKILTLFLQVLDDGRLTDGVGRTIGFENTIIIATSNAGSLLIAQSLQKGQTMEQIEGQVNDELLKVFRPELVNRFDDIVLFKPLSQQDLQRIVALKLTQLQNQMKEKGYLIEFDGQLLSELAKRGVDPIMGARPLRRLIQDTIESRLSRLILEGKLQKGEKFEVTFQILS